MLFAVGKKGEVIVTVKFQSFPKGKFCSTGYTLYTW